jgi:Caspase domain
MVLSLLSERGVTAAQRQAFPLLQSATPDDLVVIYIASHGYADPNGKFYVIPSDIGEPAGVSEQLLDRCLAGSEQSAGCHAAREFLRRSISSDELTQWLQAVDAGEMVLVLDSCHSAAVAGPNFKPGPMGDRSFGQLSYDKRMRVLTATQAENVAWGTLELGDRSLLTYALTKQQTHGQGFDFRQWLSRAEKQVPELYRRYVKGATALHFRETAAGAGAFRLFQKTSS